MQFRQQEIERLTSELEQLGAAKASVEASFARYHASYTGLPISCTRLVHMPAHMPARASAHTSAHAACA